MIPPLNHSLPVILFIASIIWCHYKTKRWECQNILQKHIPSAPPSASAHRQDKLWLRCSGLPDLHIFIISAISLPYSRRCHGTGAGAASHGFSRSTLNDSHFDVFFSGDGYFFNGCGFDIDAVLHCRARYGSIPLPSSAEMLRHSLQRKYNDGCPPIHTAPESCRL